MWPWGHFAVGYLLYVAVTRLRGGRRTSLTCLIAVGIGTQFPDLVDKPLAWTFAILPSGRSLAHSLLVAILIIALVSRLTDGSDRPHLAAPFGIGYISHLVADLGPEVVIGLLQGDLSQLQWTTYLLWPILPAPPYPNDESFLQHFLMFEFDPYVTFQFLLFGVAIVVWVADGSPGLSQLRRLIAKRRLLSPERP